MSCCSKPGRPTAIRCCTCPRAWPSCSAIPSTSGSSTPRPRATCRRKAGSAARCSADRRSVNGMMYFRGHPEDYNEWARMGCSGWGWSDIGRAFRSIENHEEAGGDRVQGGAAHHRLRPPGTHRADRSLHQGRRAARRAARRGSQSSTAGRRRLSDANHPQGPAAERGRGVPRSGATRRNLTLETGRR